MLPKKQHLTGSKNFRLICQRGHRVPSKNFTLFAAEAVVPSWQVAVVASRKVAKAVTRNKLKRMLWHSIADQVNQFTLAKFGYVFVLKQAACSTSKNYLDKELDEALRRLQNRLNLIATNK